MNYKYTAYGVPTIEIPSDLTTAELSLAQSIRDLNIYLYKGYVYDQETGLYYCHTRYYNPNIGRWISIDDVSYLDPGTIGGMNLYTYCGNNPVMYLDSDGYAPWWNWAISGAQLVGGIALCFVPGAQGIGVTLIIGGTLGLIANAASPAIGQAIGGASSMANGYGAISTGSSILGLGLPGLIGGIALIGVGTATMAFGANEIAGSITGNNYIQSWTGMSDTAYGWTYIGLNIASSVGQVTGRAYNLHNTRVARFGHTGNLKGYHYYNQRGNILFDFDYPHGNINYNHFHGWSGPGMTGRTGDHWSYIELIQWLFGGK